MDEEIGGRLQGAATRLFAELGYDAVTTQMIAGAAGVDPDVVNERYGGKPALYLASIEWATQRWMDRLRTIGESYTPDAEGMIRVMDEYLLHCLKHPELPRLWNNRWMSDASDIPGVEERFSAPVVRASVDLVAPAARPGVDPEALLWTVVWSIHGYVQAGFLDERGRRRRPDDPETLDRFRRHVHELLRLMGRPAAES